MAIGKLFEKDEEGLGLFVEWEVFKAPKAFQHFSPFNSQLLYA